MTMHAVRPRTDGKATARILVVEDDKDSAEALVDLLESEGYQVWHSANASGWTPKTLSSSPRATTATSSSTSYGAACAC